MTPALSRVSADLLRHLSRREWFGRIGSGFAGLALGTLLAEERARSEPSSGSAHYPARTRAVIQLFQHGGPSHMDTLDPKPELNRQNGQPMPKYFTDLVKITAHGNLLGT